MYDIDQPRSFFITFLEEFLKETERSILFFFAFMVFFFTFLLALFGRDGWYTGLIGVFCLLLLKARDIVGAFGELRKGNDELHYAAREARRASEMAEKSAGEIQQIYTAFNDSAVRLMADNFHNKFNAAQPEIPEESNLLQYLKSCQKIIEAAELFFPDQPLNRPTRQALNSMTSKAEDYLLASLTEKYHLSDENADELRRNAGDPDKIEQLLKAKGADETTLTWLSKIMQLLNWIQSKTRMPPQSSSSTPPVPAEAEKIPENSAQA